MRLISPRIVTVPMPDGWVPDAGTMVLAERPVVPPLRSRAASDAMNDPCGIPIRVFGPWEKTAGSSRPKDGSEGQQAAPDGGDPEGRPRTVTPADPEVASGGVNDKSEPSQEDTAGTSTEPTESDGASAQSDQLAGAFATQVAEVISLLNLDDETSSSPPEHHLLRPRAGQQSIVTTIGQAPESAQRINALPTQVATPSTVTPVVPPKPVVGLGRPVPAKPIKKTKPTENKTIPQPPAKR